MFSMITEIPILNTSDSDSVFSISDNDEIIGVSPTLTKMSKVLTAVSVLFREALELEFVKKSSNQSSFVVYSLFNVCCRFMY